jgi:hypothetical protein
VREVFVFVQFVFVFLRLGAEASERVESFGGEAKMSRNTFRGFFTRLLFGDGGIESGRLKNLRTSSRIEIRDQVLEF